MLDLPIRPRRNRKSAAMRSMLCETRLHPADFVLPLFLLEGEKKEEPVPSMPGCFRRSVDLCLEALQSTVDLGVQGVVLFPVVPEEKKDSHAKESLNPNGLIPLAVQAIKTRYPDLCVFTDVALDPYSSDGHDGILSEDGEILNDETVEILCSMALMHAVAGADVVSPSDMMDGRVGAIRQHLDDAGFPQTGILSYAAKYASSFYGPFRDALGSAPKHGDKKTYQMDPANLREAIREVELDIAEGADIVMVKPALAYLDIVFAIKERFSTPVAAYQVSGEYSMTMAASEKGWVDGEAILMESLTAMKRAGSDLIFTYFAERAAKLSS